MNYSSNFLLTWDFDSDIFSSCYVRNITSCDSIVMCQHPEHGVWAMVFEPAIPIPSQWCGKQRRQHSMHKQATGLDAWASRVKCPARFVSHLHEICIYIWVVYSLCFFCCLFITVTWWYVWCVEWASGNQEEVQACLVTLWLFIISCYSLYKTTLGLLCSWFENNPHFHKYSMDFHV